MARRKTEYLATVRLDREDQSFVIQAPDFPEVEERSRRFDDVDRIALGAIRSSLRSRRARGRSIPKPVSRCALQSRPQFRDCCLVGVEVDLRDEPSGS